MRAYMVLAILNLQASVKNLAAHINFITGRIWGLAVTR